MLNFLDAITPGSWPDWFAAAGTSLAFWVAAVSYWRSVKLHRQEQARLVYSKTVSINHHEPGTRIVVLPDGCLMGSEAEGVTLQIDSHGNASYVVETGVFQLVAAIHNGSRELIGPVKIQVVNTGRRRVYDTFAVSVETVEPESDVRVSFVFRNEAYPGGQPSLGTTLLFRDATGNWWRRAGSQPIEQVHNDPENEAPLPAQRARYAANARALGSEPSPEPKVPLSVRWHRFWRRRKGKSSIP